MINSPYTSRGHVTSIAQARRWLDELTTNPAISVELIARRERCSMRKVTMTVSLAFLAPPLVKAVIAGALPRGIGVTRLCDLPAEWSRQYTALGLLEPWTMGAAASATLT